MTPSKPLTPTERLERWIESLTESVPGTGLVWTTKDEVRAAFAAMRSLDATQAVEPGLREALNAAYRERNAVVAALIRSNGWPAEVVMAPDTEGWWIVYAETPQGQVSWHIGPDDMDLFSDWPVAFGSRKSPWDGHSTEEKYRRLAAARSSSAPLGSDQEKAYRQGFDDGLARSSSAPAELDAAWKEAEEALPVGTLLLSRWELGTYRAVWTGEGGSPRGSVDGPTPAAALLALAARLTSSPENPA